MAEEFKCECARKETSGLAIYLICYFCVCLSVRICLSVAKHYKVESRDWMILNRSKKLHPLLLLKLYLQGKVSSVVVSLGRILSVPENWLTSRNSTGTSCWEAGFCWHGWVIWAFTVFRISQPFPCLQMEMVWSMLLSSPVMNWLAWTRQYTSCTGRRFVLVLSSSVCFSHKLSDLCSMHNSVHRIMGMCFYAKQCQKRWWTSHMWVLIFVGNTCLYLLDCMWYTGMASYDMFIFAHRCDCLLFVCGSVAAKSIAYPHSWKCSCDTHTRQNSMQNSIVLR